MGKKKSKNNQGEKKNSNDEQQLQPQPQQQKKKTEDSEGGGGKQDDGLTTAVLKVPMDCECEGCATKIRRFVRGIQGVETVKGGGELSKLTVAGKIDPVKLQEMVEQKVGKKVQLVSPVPKKDNKDKDGGGGGGEKKAEGKPDKKPDEKKSKEPQVTTAVMKVNLHCQGCIHKIRKTVTKTPGFQDMSIDEQKDQVTVKGTMDMKALAEALKERLKRSVEIVQPKKDNAEKKEKGGGGGGGGKKEKGGGSEEGKTGGDDGGGQVMEENRIQYVPQEYPNTYMYGYGLGYPVEQYHHAPQMFSDENPNACSVM
ncbi:heavy metal-associated isoprenylated plant protein 3-like [Rhododendron vialii]|uniref:heavy metal-associated isoprenylated plant protein 3-like n=1 Tax=Rhododendron vialii TaxID=182163 RepID=UPI00265DCF64|nr:heavy metal-associated isoprenylated plant protein 3-like [Rhododendron vialii]